MLVVLLLAVVPVGCGGNHSTTTTASSGPRTSYRFAAKLNSAQEVPKPKGATDCSGALSGTITINGASGTLTWRLSYKGLTGRATAARIYLGRPGTTGVVASTVCAPCRPRSHGSLGANAALLQALLGGPAYVNVHTRRNPKGEIRGRLIVMNAAGPSPGG
jgi:hypothetical protein